VWQPRLANPRYVGRPTVPSMSSGQTIARYGTSELYPRSQLRGSKPERGSGRLHRLVDHGQQLGRERVRVDLIAQAGAERLDRASGVKAATVEAPAVPTACHK